MHIPVSVILMIPDNAGLPPAQLRAVMFTWYCPEEFREMNANVPSYMTSVALSTATV